MATPVVTGERAPSATTTATTAATVRTATQQRLRQLTGTAPARLRAAGVVLTTLVLLFGALTAWQVSVRAKAAGQVVTHSQPLSQDAAEIYRSLADADTTAASAFLLAGDAPPPCASGTRATWPPRPGCSPRPPPGPTPARTPSAGWPS
ncbi:hypothetical protein ACFQ0T_11880 [Kitasatospora gansuensis]